MAQCTPSVYDTAALPPSTSDDPWAKETLRRRPAGFGPYTLAAADSSEVRLAAHDRYYRGRPAIDEVVVRPFGSESAAAEAVVAGEADLAFGLSLDEAVRLRGQRHVRVIACQVTPGLALTFDLAEPPFDNPLVRQAIACAVPYEEIVQTAYLGGARPWRSWLQPEAPGYADDLWPYDEDPDRAKTLLAAAGLADGFQTRLAAEPDGAVGVAAEVLRHGLARVGILVTTEPAGSAPLRLRGPSGRGHRVFDPMYGLYHDFGPGRMRLTPSAYENPELYSALRAIADAGHGAPWERAVRHAQQVLNADAAAIPICAPFAFAVHQAGLTGYRWYPDNRLPFFDMAWR
jgi:peptide/nickel transport system substrate-binding protein